MGPTTRAEPPRRSSRRVFLGTCMSAAVAGTARGAAGQQVDPTVDANPIARKRADIRSKWLELLGDFPESAPPLQPESRRVEPIGGIECHYVTYQTEPGERVPGYLLVPESAKAGAAPAMFCIHPTTHGAGKRRAVGLCGRKPTDPPEPPATSCAYALELARWGYVTFTIDLMCDGERIPEGYPHYDTRAFYAKHPEWSAVGKNVWDTMRGIDFLETLDFVDPERIGCVGHSLGGHSTVFAAAFDERIACAVSCGGMLSWVRHEDHWSRPMGDNGPINAYVYIRKFRPYIEDPELPLPVDFDDLMTLVAPRPLLVTCTEDEGARDSIVEKTAAARTHFGEVDAGDRLALFTFPGSHSYPPDAKRLSFAWLDRWLGHTPAVPTIWPRVAI